MKISRIDGYNGKYRSNPQGIRQIYGDLFELDQIRRWIDDRNSREMVFYDRELQDDTMESKIIKFDFHFEEKLKIEVGWKFWNVKLLNQWK